MDQIEFRLQLYFQPEVLVAPFDYNDFMPEGRLKLGAKWLCRWLLGFDVASGWLGLGLDTARFMALLAVVRALFRWTWATYIHVVCGCVLYVLIKTMISKDSADWVLARLGKPTTRSRDGLDRACGHPTGPPSELRTGQRTGE